MDEQTREALGKFTGLVSPDSWNNPDHLLRAKARVALADKNSLQQKALISIEEALAHVYEKHLVFETERHGRVRNLFRKWERSELDIEELWMSLREIIEGPRDHWDGNW